MDPKLNAPGPSGVEVARAHLRRRFPNREAVTPSEALRTLGLSRAKNVGAAARQMLLRGTYPLPTIVVGGHRVVPLSGLGEHPHV